MRHKLLETRKIREIDGQNNVSRIASEWGRVKESYNYDPYGNLTYGIPDTVNYYGYNGESQNLATGLQYLRARYYNPHTGNFLTEDTYPGQLSDPLSLNRYDYVSNNPVNYSDPSGHIKLPDWMKDGIDNMKKGVEDVANTVKKGVKSAVDTVKNGVKSAVDTVKKAVKGVGETIKKSYTINQQNKEREQDMLEEFLLGDDEDTGGKNTTSGKDDSGDEPTNKPDMQDTAEDDADNALEQACKNVCDWVEENEAAIKITAGTVVIAATGAATVLTNGATAKNFLGAAIGGVAGGLLHMLFADEDEKTEGFADGYLLGAAAGAVSPSISSLVSNLKGASSLLSNGYVLSAIEGFLETAVEEVILVLEGEDISIASVGFDFLINCFTSGYNPQMDKLGKGMEKVAKKLGKWFEDTVEKGQELIKKLFKEGPDPQLEKIFKKYKLKNTQDVWKLKGTDRGKAIEEILAHTDYKDWWNCGSEMGGYFPAVDFSLGNDVVSLKTIDPNLKSYQNGKVNDKIEEYITDLASYNITIDGN